MLRTTTRSRKFSQTIRFRRSHKQFSNLRTAIDHYSRTKIVNKTRQIKLIKYLKESKVQTFLSHAFRHHKLQKTQTDKFLPRKIKI